MSRRVRALEEDLARLQGVLVRAYVSEGKELPDDLCRMVGEPPADLARRVRVALGDARLRLIKVAARLRRARRARWPRSGSKREIMRVLQEHAVELDAIQYTMKAACDAAGVGDAVPDRWRRPHLTVVRGGDGAR